MQWDTKTEEKFKQLISKLPFFHRHIAEEVVRKESEELATKRGSDQVEDKDLTEAFLTEVPEVFRDYLNKLLEEADLKR